MKSAELFEVSGYGVIVTGGASGIGLGFTEALAANGARVTMFDIDARRLKDETHRLTQLGFDVAGQVVDVTDHTRLDAATDAVSAAYGRLDVVFANAGIDPGPGYRGPLSAPNPTRSAEYALQNYPDERWNQVIDVNLNGVFATVRAAARHMVPRRSGRIIITTSLAARQVAPVGAAYMAAKAGATHFMRTAALELAAYNITVNAIAPGMFVTNIGGGHSHDKGLQEAVARAVPLRRVAFPKDMYALALFLASPGSSYLTGQEIGIDGGWGVGNAD